MIEHDQADRFAGKTEVGCRPEVCRRWRRVAVNMAMGENQPSAVQPNGVAKNFVDRQRPGASMSVVSSNEHAPGGAIDVDHYQQFGGAVPIFEIGLEK